MHYFSSEKMTINMENSPFSCWESAFKEATSLVLNNRKHGFIPKWDHLLSTLPSLSNTSYKIDESVVSADSDDKFAFDYNLLEQQCLALSPWRKGPFDLFGLYIDGEWRSDMKWSRVISKIGNLSNKTVLDVGCGNGYYLFRMLGAGAKAVLGIDPSYLCATQFALMRHFFPDNLPLWMLPLSDDELPLEIISKKHNGFDVVFSMGVLYHRRDYKHHLDLLHKCLSKNGIFILETLIIKSNEKATLIPDGSYAKMRNVWSVPSLTSLKEQLELSGFVDVCCIDVTATTTKEQRSTKWMQGQSLADFLDPEDHQKTIEGYPAPIRAIFKCRKK